MRKRYQAGSVVRSKDDRYWLGKYRDGSSRTRILGKLKGPERITKSEARAKLDEILKSIKVVNAAAAPDVTVKDFIENVFLPFKRKRWRKLTNEARTDSIALHIVGKFGNRVLASLRRDELQEWLDSLYSEAG